MPEELAIGMDHGIPVVGVPTFYAVEHGWLMRCGDPAEYSEPVDGRLEPLLALCRARGIEWVRFDQDADLIDGIPNWQW